MAFPGSSARPPGGEHRRCLPSPEAHVEQASSADCYALAGVLHALLTGAPPKVGGDAAALATVSGG